MTTLFKKQIVSLYKLYKIIEFEANPGSTLRRFFEKYVEETVEVYNKITNSDYILISVLTGR